MKFIDTVAVAGTRRRDDGYLVADARIARTGIQDYLGTEVGRPDLAVVRVYRPGTEVFSDATLKSAAHRPVTNGHPPDLVTSENWKTHAVGQTGDEVRGEGIYIRVPLMVSDEAAIRDIEAGKQELSAGYTCELDFRAGVTEAGEAYDAIQKNIRLNHVAVVRQGRAGSEIRIGDRAASTNHSAGHNVAHSPGWGAMPIIRDSNIDNHGDKTMPQTTITVDGATLDVGDAVAKAIAALERQLADRATALTDAEAAHAADIALRDAALARKDAEIETLKAGANTSADLDRRVEARAGLIAAARAIVGDLRIEGLSDAAIRRAVVIARLGDAAVDGKPDAYIDARFDILAEASLKTPADPFRAALAGGLVTSDRATTRDRAYAGMVTRLEHAWKMPVKGAA